jgi:hypothetical protein
MRKKNEVVSPRYISSLIPVLIMIYLSIRYVSAALMFSLDLKLRWYQRLWLLAEIGMLFIMLRICSLLFRAGKKEEK